MADRRQRLEQGNGPEARPAGQLWSAAVRTQEPGTEPGADLGEVRGVNEAAFAAGGDEWRFCNPCRELAAAFFCY